MDLKEQYEKAENEKAVFESGEVNTNYMIWLEAGLDARTQLLQDKAEINYKVMKYLHTLNNSIYLHFNKKTIKKETLIKTINSLLPRMVRLMGGSVTVEKA